MSDEFTFREVTSDEGASFLMPGQGEGLYIVLFCDAQAPAVQKAERLVPEVEVPPDWEFVVLDTERAEGTARWFGVGDSAGMAVIQDGQMLSVEYECSLDAFRRLIRVARKQEESLRD